MKWIISILLFGLPYLSQAQTWAEWTRQKKTQRKYLAQQIAALQVYVDYAKKGYRIADAGLSLIQSGKKGDFDLHHTYFNSLAEVNPAIKNCQKVASIIIGHFQIVKQTKEALYSVQQNGQYTSAEIASCKNTINNLLADCLTAVEHLVSLLADTEFQMTDDERMKGIDSLYTDMQDKKTFTASFLRAMELLSIGRMVEAMETKRSRILNGVK
ncbi:MAG: hypothetical protein EOO13_02775 [Chitinophagaceae bacterium]|nr:MAG: hypothetical protein EOO13_02775 [Chitinophagaceae bacterium]